MASRRDSKIRVPGSPASELKFCLLETDNLFLSSKCLFNSSDTLSRQRDTEMKEREDCGQNCLLRGTKLTFKTVCLHHISWCLVGLSLVLSTILYVLFYTFLYSVVL